MPDWGENPGVTRKSESSQPHRLYIRPQSVSICIHDVVSYLELLLALTSCQRTSLLTSSRTPVRYEISGSATERDTQHRYRPPITSLPLYSKQRSFLWSALQTCAAHGLHGNLVHNCHNLSPAYSQSIPSFCLSPGKVHFAQVHTVLPKKSGSAYWLSGSSAPSIPSTYHKYEAYPTSVPAMRLPL